MPTSELPAGREFERHVADFYRGLGWKVETNIRLNNQEIDIIASRHVEGLGPLISLIECKDWDRRLTNQEVQNFAATVITLRESGRVHSGVLVSRRGFTADAKGAADGISYVSLITLEELENDILSASAGIRLLAQDYQEQDIFNEFIEIDGRHANWSHNTKERNADSLVRNVCADIRKSILEGSVNNFFLLGDYGAGKSTLLRRLQYRLCQDMLDGRGTYLPTFVPLKNYYNVQDISALLRNSVREDFLREFSGELLARYIRQGRFIFLLDGFDEMTERSGEDKRNELFQRILPILTSSCPTVLTSRPSMFVARGEIERLVSRWKAEAVPLPSTATRPIKPSKNSAQRYEYIDRLRESLLAGLRSEGATPKVAELPSEDSLAVINLNPLDPAKIRKYITQRLETASKSNLNADETLSFIERVYDLSDLAKRPLLLRLIVDTIFQGGIDVTDPTLKFGPSDLYEIYTSLKLDVDWGKGVVRRRGLTREQRREFAEAVAVAMYRSGTLHVEMKEVMQLLASASTQFTDSTVSDTENIAKTSLSPDEVATDLMTCSFLTIDDRQICRFVHKSFMEFFVARTIKMHLTLHNPLLQNALPTQILYFLGGFSPTNRNDSQQLWMRFMQAPTQEVALRGNLLAAFMFSSPTHTSRRIRDVEMRNVIYESIAWSDANLRRCRLIKINFQRLTLTRPSWAEVFLNACSLKMWSMENGYVSCETENSDFGTVEVKEIELVAISRGSRIDRIELHDSTATIELHDSFIGRLSAQQSDIIIRVNQSRVREVYISGSTIGLDDESMMRDVGIDSGLIRDSFVNVSDVRSLHGAVRFENCIVDISHGPSESGPQALPASVLSNMSANSCVYAMKMEFPSRRSDRMESANQVTCGIIGAAYFGSLNDIREFRGWGVLIAAGEETVRETSKKGFTVVRGDLLLCTKEWLAQQAFAKDALIDFMRANQIHRPHQDFTANDARPARSLREYIQTIASNDSE
jgi:hypothetical protein